MKQTNRQTMHRPGVAPAAGIALAAALAAGVPAGLAGCAQRVTLDPIQVEPIHLTLDITLRVDRELDRFFDFEDPAPADDAVEGGAS